MAVACYYCTGHGLGHATRTVEVIKELLSLEGFREIVLVSSLPTEVFACLDGDRFRYRQLEQPLDCGGISDEWSQKTRAQQLPPLIAAYPLSLRQRLIYCPVLK